MSFYDEREIKAIRKPRNCDGCGRTMEVGVPALRCSGVGDEGFWYATYHRECRKAEEALNELHDWRAGDDWMILSDLDWEDWPWLIEDFPEIAERMKITTERFEKVQAEQERARKVWAEIDRKRYEQDAR